MMDPLDEDLLYEDIMLVEAENGRLRAALEELKRELIAHGYAPKGLYIELIDKALINYKELSGYTWCEVVHVSDTEGTRGHGFMALVPNSTLAEEG